MAIRLTKKKMEALEYDGNGESPVTVYDEAIPAFGVRIYPSGTKSFILLYRNENNRLRMITLGKFGVMTLKLAGNEARKKLVEVAQGEDPQAKRKRAKNAANVDALADAYIEKHAKPHKKTWMKDESRLDRHIKPVRGKRAVKGIAHSDVADLHRKIGKSSGHYEANRTRALVQTIFNFAIHEGLVPPQHPNPAANVRKFQGGETRPLGHAGGDAPPWHCD